MNLQELKYKIGKIIKANTDTITHYGQYDQVTGTTPVIKEINEFKEDLFNLLDNQYKVGTIDKKDIFIGTGKLGASYEFSEAREIARVWGFKYVAWNDDKIYDLEGVYQNITYKEI